MANYQKADSAVDVRVKDLVRRWHVELEEAGVTILILFAYPATEGTPALKFANWPAAALARITPLADRAAGLEDCQIKIDFDWWQQHGKAEQEALLDHELTHFELRRDEQGKVRLDDLGRPKMRLRPHDFQIGGFDLIMDRHREFAVETQAAVQLGKKVQQLKLPWG